MTATGPADLIVASLGWRGLFALLGALSALAALLVLLAVPHTSGRRTASRARQAVSLSTIYRDPRFWRMAPLSTIGIGTSWSLQGLWAAPWLKDVAGFDRATVVHHLGAMAIALSASALLLGAAADRLRRAGIRTEVVLASTLALSMAAQFALVLGWPLPSYLLRVVIAAAGAATVLSYAILASYFPREASGRANAALNLLHMGVRHRLHHRAVAPGGWPISRRGAPGGPRHRPCPAACSASLVRRTAASAPAFHAARCRAHGARPAEEIQAMLARFNAVYGGNGNGTLGRIVASGAAHHRLLPFLDGNGRVARLFSHAHLQELGIGCELWSISRGLARNVERYKHLLMAAHEPRHSDIDGRGAPSLQALEEFCKFFLCTSIDQDPQAMRASNSGPETSNVSAISRQSWPLLREAALTGEFPRGKAPALTGYQDRQARLRSSSPLRCFRSVLKVVAWTRG